MVVKVVKFSVLLQAMMCTKLRLVQQCHSLELLIGTNYLQLCLRNPSEACLIIKEAKTDILAGVYCPSN